MQNHGGSTATTAILAAEREFHARLLVDWNRDGLFAHTLSDMSKFIKSASTDRSLKGGAPEAMTLIEGAGAAQLSLSLSGDYLTMPLSGLFSPYQSQSPFYMQDILGCEVTYELGIQTSLGMVWYPQFVGNLRLITPDRGTGYVEITALDRVEVMRRPILFPAWAMYEFHASRGIIEAQLADTQWVIDHCLRECRISPTPYRPTSREENGLADNDVTGPQIWINGTGSWLPSIGWLDNWNVQQFPHTEDSGINMYMDAGSVNPNSPEPAIAPLALAALGNTGDSVLKYWCTDRDRMSSQGMQVLGFTIITRGDNGNYYKTAPEHEVINVRLGDYYVISVMIENGQVWTEFEDEILATVEISTRVTIPTTGDYQRVNVAWDYFNAAGPLVYVAAGVNTNNAGAYEDLGTVVSHVANVDELKGLFALDHRVALNDIFYTATNFGSLTVAQALEWAGLAPDYVAVVDNGRNGISYSPIRQADDAWEVVANAASAEFGSVFWDEDGVFRFWNSIRMKDLQTVIVRELSLDDVTGLQITNSLDSVRNIWSVSAGKRRAYEAVSYESSSVDEFYTAGVTRNFFRIWSDDLLSPNPGLVTRYTSAAGGPLPQWNDLLDHGYVVQWFDGTNWAENDSRAGVDIYVYFDNEGKVVVNLWNGWAEPIRLAQDNGQAAFRVGGTKIETFPEQVTITKNLDSIDRYGGKNLRLDGDFYQEMYDYDNMISLLMPGTERPVPTTQAITIAGDPRLQLGDTIRIRDRVGFGDRFDVQILGIRRTYSVDAGLIDVLTVEMIAPPGGIWDDSLYGIWGSTFIWGD
jgi:hypothetical protein